MNLLKVASVIAVLFAILFFLHSLLNLLGFVVSTRALAPEASPNNLFSYITSILTNFTTITQVFTLLEALFGAIIFFTFERIAKKIKSLFLRTSAIFLIIATLLPGISTLCSIGQIPFSLTEKSMIVGVGILSILFGIALVRVKAAWSILATALGVLYILEGLILISTYWIPARLLEFSIAIALVEAVLFWKSEKI